MPFEGKKIGFVLTGAFSLYESIIPQISKLIENGAEVLPIMSFHAYHFDTKFGRAQDFKERIENITGKKIINTIQDAEAIGLKNLTDLMVIAPCTGNTIAKLANDIIDTPALMAAKSHLRNENNIVIGICTNNGLGSNAQNIGKLLNMKHMYFIPFRQDNPITKPRSLVFTKIG